MLVRLTDSGDKAGFAVLASSQGAAVPSTADLRLLPTCHGTRSRLALRAPRGRRPVRLQAGQLLSNYCVPGPRLDTDTVTKANKHFDFGGQMTDTWGPKPFQRHVGPQPGRVPRSGTPEARHRCGIPRSHPGVHPVGSPTMPGETQDQPPWCPPRSRILGDSARLRAKATCHVCRHVQRPQLCTAGDTGL